MKKLVLLISAVLMSGVFSLAQKHIRINYVGYLPKSVKVAVYFEEKGVDELLTLTGLKLENLLMNLTTMELKGIIKQGNGDRYKKV